MTVPYPLPFPAANPDDTPLMTVQFNQDWLPVLLRATEDYYAVETWEGAPDNKTAILDQLTAQLMTNIIISPQVFPTTLWHPHRYSVTLLGNAIAFLAVASCPLGGYWRQSPAVGGDRWTFPVFLDEGSYGISFNWQRQTNSGILTLFLDDASVPFMTQDMYGTAAINLTGGGSFGLSVPGLHTITGKLDSKNPSSSGYVCAIQDFYIQKF